MNQHRSASTPEGEVSVRALDLHPSEVTDVFTLSDVNCLADLGRTSREDRRADFHASIQDTQVMAPVTLSVVQSDDTYDADMTEVIPRTIVGQHRKPATSALRGRIMIAAMAAGAAAAAAHTALNPVQDEGAPETVLAADAAIMPLAAPPQASDGMQVVSVAPITDASLHSEELARGTAFAQERAEREARLSRPLFVRPVQGIFTSGFGYRWGALHGGVDIANAIGTPIYAVSDGVVVDVGPTAGYGAWVKLRHADGTVTLYGHINSWLVSMGQQVMAGDQIATVGNRGNSTGPHLHLEVLVGGSDRIDPVPWLATRGVNVGGGN